MRERLFFITYISANVSLVLYGVLACLMPSILLEPFLLHVYRFPDDPTGAAVYLAALFRLLGFFNVIMGMLVLLLLHRFRVTRQAWILRIVIAFTVLAFIGPIIFDNTVGSIGFFEIVEHVLFVLVVILGIIMLRNRDIV